MTIIDERVPWIRAINAFDEARATLSTGVRLDKARVAAKKVGDELRNGPRAACVRTLPLTTLFYPTTFAFNRASMLPWPFVLMTHRSLLVQVFVEGEVKNILFNPSDVKASRATPFFADLIDRLGERTVSALIKDYGTVPEQLATHGIRPEDIDVVAYDHFHTQDLRPILGTDTQKATFPNAFLLAPKQEWLDWDHLHPLQRAWFIEDGKRGVPESKVILTDHDLKLGDGCLLLRTPGHTSGNQTVFVNGDRGVFGCSENGCSADNWSPRQSRIPGLKRFAEHYDFEVILNSNTPELGAEQYVSMIIEKTVADRVPEAPEFFQMFPSSEVTPTAFAPGIRPSMLFGERDSGVVQSRRISASSATGSLQSSKTLH
ncbi:MAG: hypothetical protein R3A47_11365 [Polyangiales bacterium]